jgi:hypothetical protein
MKKGKITHISPKGEYTNAKGTFYKYQVRFNDGNEYQFLAKGDFKKPVGSEVFYSITNEEYKTARLEYNPQPTNNYTKPQTATSKDLQICKMSSIRAAAELNSGRPQADRVSVLEDAKYFYNWIIS